MARSEYLSKVLVGLVSPIWRLQGHRDRKGELFFFCGVAGIMGLRGGICEFILCVWHVDLSWGIELWFVGRPTAHLWKESQGDVVEIRISLEVLPPSKRVPWTPKFRRNGLLTLSKWRCFLLISYYKMLALRTESRFSKRYLHAHVHNSIIHKQEMGATQMSTMAE